MRNRCWTASRRRVAAAVIAMAIAADARGAQTVDRYLDFSLFGTLGIVHSDYGLADFTGNVIQLRGAGLSGRWSGTPDSDLGAQMNLTIDDRLSGVVQVLSRDNLEGNFKPVVEWANLKYDFTDNFSVTVGRILLPTFQRADVQNVGYSLPWVRIPLEINYADSAENSDGLEGSYSWQTGPVKQTLLAQLGYTDENIPGAAFATVRTKLAMASDALQIRDFTAQVVYQHYEHSGNPSLRQDLLGAGVTYDPGAYFLTVDGNYTKNSFFGSSIAWSASAGFRIGQFTPYGLFAATQARGVGASGLPALGNERTQAAGLRWDFIHNMDVKMQFDTVALVSVDDTAAFANIQPDARPGDKAHVLSLTVDFIF
jgi:hypothetical protein